jgi:ABC-2 type transport system ATP-binding protein
MNERAIEVSGLRFAYGTREVLRGVDLVVPAGSIFGFLGRNGAGKTTLIKLLLGLLRPSAGACRLLGLDSAREPIAVRQRVGYMAEDQRMHGWMRVEQVVRWVASLYPKWDQKLSDDLLERMELPRKAKVKTLSKGQNSRLALLLALGHRPKVVILDDPTLGLDPISRKEFLRDVIGLLQSNGVTVFFSSHLLYEIEPVADYVAILHEGRIIRAGRTEELREGVRRLIFTPLPDARLDRLEGVLDVSRAGEAVALTVSEFSEASRAALTGMSRNGVQEQALNLDEIFESYVIGNRGKGRQVGLAGAGPGEEVASHG